MSDIQRTMPALSPREDLTPLLFWNEIATSGTGAALACPQCAGPNLHLAAIHVATPAADDYPPTIGVTIDPDSGAVIADDAARELHGGDNRGAMVSIGYWCEEGHTGRIELRNHKATCSPACTPPTTRPRKTR